MKETFTDDLIAMQEDPSYYSPQRLQQLKVIFDRICNELGISDVQKTRRDKLATILLVGSRLYLDEDALVNGAIKAMTLPGED
jgi:hypothetical protein